MQFNSSNEEYAFLVLQWKMHRAVWGSFGCFVVSSLSQSLNAYADVRRGISVQNLRALDIITWPNTSVDIGERKRYLLDSERKT